MPPNIDEAIRHYQLAINKGQDAEAYNALGLMAEQGLGLEMTEDGVKENGLIKAAKYYEQAIQKSKGTFADA